MSLKMPCLMKKLLDIKWKGCKLRNKIGTYEIDKISISWYVLHDGVNTLAYFHKGCNKKCDKNKNNNHNNNHNKDKW